MAPFARILLPALAGLLAAGCGGKSSDDPAEPPTFLKHFGGASEDTAVALSVYGDGSTVVVGTVFLDTLFGAGEPGERLIASFDKRSVYVAQMSPEGDLLGVEPISGDHPCPSQRHAMSSAIADKPLRFRGPSSVKP